MPSIQGKKAIVTGATRGIGRAIAKMLLKEGAEVAICSRTATDVSTTVSELSTETGGRISGTACNVREENDIRKFFEFADDRLSSLDILINNAGIGVFRPVAEMSPEDWRATLDTNLTSVYHFCHYAMARFRKSGGGAVVNISSLAGKNPFAGGSAYNASKFGLEGFTESLMLDHRTENVRVCSIMPGSVATQFGRARQAEWMIQSEDIAEVVRMVLRMPERTMVSRVEMRPSKPGK